MGNKKTSIYFFKYLLENRKRMRSVLRDWLYLIDFNLDKICEKYNFSRPIFLFPFFLLS